MFYIAGRWASRFTTNKRTLSVAHFDLSLRTSLSSNLYRALPGVLPRPLSSTKSFDIFEGEGFP